MKNILIIGGSTPLQKLLPHFFNTENIKIVAVFLDPKVDHSAKMFCKQNQINSYSYSEIVQQIEKFNSINIDWLFNINSTFILSDKILNIPSKGALNLHPGLLPAYAGLHTHQWAIRNNEKKFGVTVHWMEAGIDTGDIAFQKIFPLTGRETGLNLFLKCLKEGVELVKISLDYITQDKEIPSIKQDLSKRKLYTQKMALDGIINWNTEYNNLLNFFRASNYKPFESPTYTPFTLLDGQKIVIDSVDHHSTYKKLPPRNIYVIDNDKILIGTKDLNVLATPELKKSNFNSLENLIDFINQSSKKLI
jgi:methionyl-tRNA formyltransferase